MKLLGFVSKAIMLLLTELVGQCRNILPLAFSALTSLRSKISLDKPFFKSVMMIAPTALSVWSGAIALKA